MPGPNCYGTTLEDRRTPAFGTLAFLDTQLAAVQLHPSTPSSRQPIVTGRKSQVEVARTTPQNAIR